MVAIYIVLLSTIAKLLGGLFTSKLSKDKFHLILGFSAGTVLGVALFDLLPESIELVSNTSDNSVVMLLVAVGFCFYMLLDRLFSLHSHNEKCKNPSHNHSLSATALVVHGMIDGLSVGLSFQVSSVVGWVVAFAVLAHSFSDGINMVGVVLRAKRTRTVAMKWLLLSMAASIVGVAVSYFIVIPSYVLGIILSVFTGLFLYISAGDLIPETHHSHPTIWTTISTILGVMVIYAISCIVG